MIGIMCLTENRNNNFLNSIGSRISARSYQQKQRGVNRSNLITISPILPLQSDHSDTISKSNITRFVTRNESQNHENLISVGCNGEVAGSPLY